MRLARSTAVKAGVTWCAVGRLAGAQLPGVAVDPHMVVLTPARPAGEITVFNPRPFASEFTVDLRFGYVTTDSSGAPVVELKDGPDSVSAAEWITPYPRKFSLAPGAAQLVRLLAHPPATLADGEYWARLTVHSHDVTAGRTVGVTSGADTTRAALTLETATVMPIFFRKGAVATGISIERLAAVRDGDSIDVSMSLRRAGNSAFLGVARVAVLDSTGHELAATERKLAVYVASATRWRVPLPPSLRASARTVTVALSTLRRDVPTRLVLQAATVRQQAPLISPFVPPH
ncbi:MAG: hypothetical protein ACR2GG_02660 [Gemmatimonadaceae bacterium]